MIRITLVFIVAIYGCSTMPKGKGKSISEGKVNNGSLINGRKLPYKGENYKYFSPLSYSLLNRAWVHAKVLDISLQSYKICEQKFPERKFLIMECSERNGGKMFPHRTHQNGTSIDFGTPLLKNGKTYHFHHHFGISHYLMKFDKKGISKLNKQVNIDFETMAKHLLILEKTARKNGMYIKKVIFKIDLKDDLFKTRSGKKLKRSGIYFARKLPKLIDEVHDDHYHVDFGFLK